MPASPYAPSSYRLLVIDHERPILELLGELLVEEGVCATLVGTLSDALDLLDRECFDVILADTLDRRTSAAAFDRWGALAAVKARAGTTPVLIFSAHPASAFVDAHERGFAGFIAKPFDLDILTQTVRVCAESGRYERQRADATFAPA